MAGYPYGQVPSGWESQVLQGIGAPVTLGNVHFLDAWEVKEHGDPFKGAAFNPFNTAMHETGSTPLKGNPYDIQEYPDWKTGLKATDDTIKLNSYTDLVKQMVAGTIQPTDNVYSPGLATWSGYDGHGNGYTQIDTSLYKQLPSGQYSDSPAGTDTTPITPSSTPSATSVATWVVVGAIVLIILFVIR